jgi:hypothetical protein
MCFHVLKCCNNSELKSLLKFASIITERNGAFYICIRMYRNAVLNFELKSLLKFGSILIERNVRFIYVFPCMEML